MNYKFKPNEKALLMSLVGAENGLLIDVVSVYTSDKENHEASPHNRCVITRLWPNKGLEVMDVAECELRKIK